MTRFTAPLSTGWTWTQRAPCYSFPAPPALALYWPIPLSSWTEAGQLLGITGKRLWGINSTNGSILWSAYTPAAYVDTLLAYAHGGGSSGSDGSAPSGPLLFVLGQGSASPSQSVYLFVYNATGGLVAQPTLVGIRVDQFQGSILLWPDGLTVTINGWAPADPHGGSPATLTTMRLDTGTGTLKTLWTAPPWAGL
jgi:hypothetical protein